MIIMGSRVWFKAIISRRKTKFEKPKQGSLCEQASGFKLKSQSKKSSKILFNCYCGKNNQGDSCLTLEERAATRIQIAFRGHQARKILRQLKRAQRLQVLSHGDSVKRQTSITLHYVHCWSKVQTEVRNRRASMATEGRIKQKKHENQVKLEAKLHDLEVEWSGGAETMEEVLSKVYQREEAAVKRERAMAYAFSHQWRANPGGVNQCHPYEFDKAGNWGWSWMERWISARPWEMRIPSPQKMQSKAAAKTIKKGNSPLKPSISASRTSAKKNSAQFDEKKVENYEQILLQ